jgi:hypothetical protein
MNWKKKTTVRKAWGMLSKGEGDGHRVNVPGLLKVPKQVWGNKRNPLFFELGGQCPAHRPRGYCGALGPWHRPAVEHSGYLVYVESNEVVVAKGPGQRIAGILTRTELAEWKGWPKEKIATVIVSRDEQGWTQQSAVTKRGISTHAEIHSTKPGEDLNSRLSSFCHRLPSIRTSQMHHRVTLQR